MVEKLSTEQLQRKHFCDFVGLKMAMISMIVLFGLKCKLLSDIWHIYGIYYMAYIIWLMLSEGLVMCLTFSRPFDVMLWIRPGGPLT